MSIHIENQVQRDNMSLLLLFIYKCITMTMHKYIEGIEIQNIFEKSQT